MSKFFALIPLIIYVYLRREFKTVWIPKNPCGLTLMCVMACAATFASFLSLRYINIAEATIIGYLTPMITAVLAIFILKETVNHVRWTAIIVGFLGILTLIIPNLKVSEMNHLYLYGIGLAVLTALLTSGSKIQAKALSSNDSAAMLALYFALTCATFGALVGLVEGWLFPNGQRFLLLVGAGMLGGTAHIMMYSGYKYSDASKLAGLEFLGLPFSVAADFVFFGILPSGIFYFSAALIIFSSVYLAIFDRQPKVRVVNE